MSRGFDYLKTVRKTKYILFYFIIKNLKDLQLLFQNITYMNWLFDGFCIGQNYKNKNENIFRN